MKLNIAYPATGSQKLIDIEDEKVVRPFYEKRMGQELAADFLGDEWKGYIVRISGGNDKQGFPMKQGVLTNNRVRLLLSKGHSCYRPRRNGERKRKSVRGCIVDSNLSVLSLVIVKKGEKEIEGITDTNVPRRLGPKRASKIRRMFNLSKKDDVKRYVIKKPLPIREGKDQKVKTKAPKIQRLITPQSRQHYRKKRALKLSRAVKNKEEKAEYAKILAVRHKEAQQKREELKRRRSSQRSSRTSESSVEVPVKKNVKLAGAATAKAAAKTAKVVSKPAQKEKAPKKDVKTLTKEASKAKETKKPVAPKKEVPAKKEAPAKKAAPSKKEAAPKKPAPAKEAPKKAAPTKKDAPQKPKKGKK